MSRFGLAALLGAFLFVASPAAAQTGGGAHDMEAHALFEAGRVAFIDERFADALAHFERAHTLSGRPELLYNIAASLDRLDREADALAAFQRYLVEIPEAANRADVELRIRVLEAHVAAQEARAAHTVTGEVVTEDPDVAAIEATLEPETTIDVAGLDEQPGTEPAHTDVTGEAWFWVVITVAILAVAGGITAAILLSQDPGYRPYSPGDVTVMTLTGTF